MNKEEKEFRKNVRTIFKFFAEKEAERAVKRYLREKKKLAVKSTKRKIK